MHAVSQQSTLLGSSVASLCHHRSRNFSPSISFPSSSTLLFSLRVFPSPDRKKTNGQGREKSQQKERKRKKDEEREEREVMCLSLGCSCFSHRGNLATFVSRGKKKKKKRSTDLHWSRQSKHHLLEKEFWSIAVNCNWHQSTHDRLSRFSVGSVRVYLFIFQLKEKNKMIMTSLVLLLVHSSSKQ